MIRHSKLLMLRSLQKLIYVLFFPLEIDFMFLNWLVIPHGKTIASISKKFLSTLAIMPLVQPYIKNITLVSLEQVMIVWKAAAFQQTSSPSFWFCLLRGSFSQNIHSSRSKVRHLLDALKRIWGWKKGSSLEAGEEFKLVFSELNTKNWPPRCLFHVQVTSYCHPNSYSMSSSVPCKCSLAIDSHSCCSTQLLQSGNHKPFAEWQKSIRISLSGCTSTVQWWE